MIYTQVFKTTDLSLDRIKYVLSYDAATGLFTWLKRTSPRAGAGEDAGWINPKTGYATIRLDGIGYRAHRLAWIYVYGEWPSAEIDHINGIRHDNRISNLRLATRSQQTINSRVFSNNTSGVRGVSYAKTKNKWQVHFTYQGQHKHLGYFKSKEDAALAYQNATRVLFEDFARAY